MFPSIRFTYPRLVLAVLPSILLAACGGSPQEESASEVRTTGTGSVSGESNTTLLASRKAVSSTSPTLSNSRPALPIPTPMTGVTLDSISNLNAALTSLKSISKVPTTRIVFDEYMSASYYRNAAVQIRNVSYVMGEILDSYYVKDYSVQAYLDRTKEYLSTLGDVVDIWEVGNEINGEWLGNNPDVVAKMTGAYDQVKAAGKTTELTLYYNKDCWEKPSNEMFTWAQNNIPDRMKQGLDYVLVSYYEEDCNGLRPDWNQVFTQLHTMFPNSKIGFGEIGTTNTAAKADYLTRYYGMQPNVPNYVGGYFWWYFKPDMIPYTQPLLTMLNNAINSVPTTGTLTSGTSTTTTSASGASNTGTSAISLSSGDWTTIYNGYGSVSYDPANGIVLSPKAPTSPSETHSALTLANNLTPRNFKLSITATVEQQLRQNSPPNPWETFWIFFNYNQTSGGKKTNYFLLKPNGVELGTAYDTVGQTFLQTGPTNVKAIGVSNTYDIEKVGNHVTVHINGQKVSDYIGSVHDVAGSIGLYSEDARVRVTKVQVTPLP